MKKKLLLLMAWVHLTTLGAPVEFLYPIGNLQREGQEEMCVIYQKNSSLELWFWSPESKLATKGLLSSFTPAGVKILPNHEGFSFVDNDRIRIKMLNKRSPQTLDFYGPYDLSIIHWIDNHSLFFSAKERNHFNLFHGTRGGDLWRLTASTHCHYLYPQKVHDTFFFIIENENGTTTICKAPYPLHLIEKKEPTTRKKGDVLKVLLEDTYPQAFSPFIAQDSIEKLVEFEEGTTVAFLKMENQENGFFLEHPRSVDRTDEKTTFSYHKLFKKQDGWHTKRLFSFDLPISLIMTKRKTETRLYESILPLLPFHDEIENFIYFSHLDEQGALNVFCYDPNTEKITQKTLSTMPGEIYFPPRRYKNNLYCGGLVHAPEEEKFPQIYIDIDEKQHFTFLKL